MSMKKKILSPLKTGFIGLVFVLSNAFATNYYVDATGGNDSNSGTSETQAWKTLNKINATGFSPGDKILFKRGEVWKGRLKISSSGSAGNPIVYSAYGSGNKPVIRDIFQQNLTWSSYDTNIWRARVSGKVWRLWEDNKELQRAHPDNPFKDLGPNFRFGWSNGYLYLYKTSNPSSSVYAFRKMGTAVSLANTKYVTLDNLDFQGGETCVYAVDTQYIQIVHCNIGKDSFLGIDISGHAPGSSAHNKILHNTIDSHFSFNDAGAYKDHRSDTRGCEDGIHITGYANDLEYAHNILKDWGHTHIYAYAPGSREIYNLHIHHNYLSTENAAYGKALDIHGNIHDLDVSYNHFYKVTGDSELNGYNNHFHHNLVEYTKHYGIRGGRGGYGNGLNMNNMNGHVHHNIFENNIFAFNDNEGIIINAYGSAGQLHDIVVRNNIFYKNGDNKQPNGKDGYSLAIWTSRYMSKITVENNIFIHAGTGRAFRYNGNTANNVNDFNSMQTVNGDIIRNNKSLNPFDDESHYLVKNDVRTAGYDIDVSLIGPEGNSNAGTPTSPTVSKPEPANIPSGAFILDRSGLH